MVIKDCRIGVLPYISSYLKKNYLEPKCPNKEESIVLFFYLPNAFNINNINEAHRCFTEIIAWFMDNCSKTVVRIDSCSKNNIYMQLF